MNYHEEIHQELEFYKRQLESFVEALEKARTADLDIYRKAKKARLQLGADEVENSLNRIQELVQGMGHVLLLKGENNDNTNQ